MAAADVKSLLAKAKAEKEANKKKKEKTPRVKKHFLKDMITEMKKVTWPTRKEMISYTLAVLVFVFLMAVFTGLLDLGSTAFVNWLSDVTYGPQSWFG